MDMSLPNTHRKPITVLLKRCAKAAEDFIARSKQEVRMPCKDKRLVKVLLCLKFKGFVGFCFKFVLEEFFRFVFRFLAS